MVPNYHLQNRIGSALTVAVASISVYPLYQYNSGVWLLWLLIVAAFPIIEKGLWYINPTRTRAAEIATVVRANSDRLFRQIHERKLARGTILAQPICNFVVEPETNLMELVEWMDIQEAIKAGIFTRADESILRYVAGNMSHFGEVAGKMDVVTHRYCQTVDYYAIRPCAAAA